jgi:cytochrome c-type biogenesis protein CcmH
MGFLVFSLFAIIALVAAAFVAWPAWRTEAGGRAARLSLAGAVGIFVIAIGGGSYLMLGAPQLAERAVTNTKDRDYAGLIATLAHDVRRNPGDVRGWLYLGAGYMKLRDPQDAAKAFARAIQVSGARAPAGLYALYGEALAQAAQGAVTPEAATAFERTLTIDPRDVTARYYLGLMHAQKREIAQALTIWKSLLADAPKDAPWRADLLDRIAVLSAGNGMAPDVESMVAGLAAELKANPNNVEGWQRLIRAYSVLRRTDKAQAALKDARTVLAKNAAAMKALDAEATALKLPAP